jgi:hypothetical protein
LFVGNEPVKKASNAFVGLQDWKVQRTEDFSSLIRRNATALFQQRKLATTLFQVCNL